jgi:hypothetical protein
VALYVVAQQARHHYPSVLDWPANFDRVNAVAWLAVLLLVSDAVLEVLQRVQGRRQTGGSSSSGVT